MGHVVASVMMYLRHHQTGFKDRSVMEKDRMLMTTWYKAGVGGRAA